MTALRASGLLLALALALGGCSSGYQDDDASASRDQSTSTPGSATPDTPTSAPPTTRQDRTPWAGLAGRRPSLARYFDRLPDSSPVRLGRVRERTSAYTSYDATYRVDGLRITGVLNVPRGPGPFPAVVLAHGWIDRAVYEQGQGMTRERNYLAERGYVALHVDYRNHAGSDDDSALERELYLGYAVDTLGAVAALRSSDLAVSDDDVSLMGRSMGGSVVLQALEIAPGYVNGGVVYSGQSSLEADNYRQWGGNGSGFAKEFVRRHGTPAQNPEAWRAMSTRPYAGRITEPVLMIHGTRDEQCPPRWASATRSALARAGVDVRLRWYAGEHHAFGPRFTDSMRDITSYLDDFP